MTVDFQSKFMQKKKRKRKKGKNVDLMDWSNQFGV